jgi:RNA polymerase sigma-70 factor (ECF subfamily)
MEHFATTRWTLVLDAQTARTPRGQQALATLCEVYWYPLYAYLRRRGHSADDAQDLTQGFFASLLEHDALDTVDKTRGRFRSFLLAALNHHVSNARDRERTKKRGGSVPHVSLDHVNAKERYEREPADQWTPERAFDRNWALAVLDRVLSRVRDECHKKGKQLLFEHLKICLTGDRSDVSYHQLGLRLEMSDGAVKQAVHRLRRRYREVLYDEIGRTVSTMDDIERELQYLIAALTI